MYQAISSVTIPQPRGNLGAFDQNFAWVIEIWLGQDIWPNDQLMANTN